MATGTVKWFSNDKGYGFITPDEPGKDVFVHQTGVLGTGYRTLVEGARVSYDAEASARGPQAVNVQQL
jgi:cold shock protein